MAVTLWITWSLIAKKEAPALEFEQKFNLKKLKKSLIEGIWALIMPCLIIGGMRLGIFTPTEAAVIAAVYAFIVGMFIYRQISWCDLPKLMLSAAKTSSVIMFLVACAMVCAWLITIADIPSYLITLLQPFIANKTLLMFMMMALVIMIGTALDFTPTVLILTPVLMPLVHAAGIDPVYFGVLFIMNTAIGLLTPPIGVVLNVTASVAKIEFSQVVKGVWPFLLAQIILLLLFIIFPQLVLFPASLLS